MRNENRSHLTEHLSVLHQALAEGSPKTTEELLEGVHPAEIADVLEALPRDLRPRLWQQVGASAKGEVLLEAHGDVRQQLIAETDDAELTAAVAGLEMDELADLDAELPISVVDAMVQAMDAQRRRRYEAIRSYPDDTAGGLMDVDAIAVRLDVTLKTVLRYLRSVRLRDGELPEHLDNLVVVDRDNNYLGVLQLSDLVSQEPDTRVSQAMSTAIPAFAAMTPASNVARLFEDRDLLSAAVVSDTGKLLGRITVDDVVDVVREEADHEVLSRAGLDQSTDMFAPVLSSTRRRALWLGINLATAFLAAWVIGLFEASIERVVALAVLMPVVASMGGVAGTQTLTLVTRGLALDQLKKSNFRSLLLKELAVSLLNGLLWALVVAVIAIAWFGSPRLGMVFGLALIANLITGAAGGTLVPIVLQRLGLDPALAGGVVLTTATDAIGFFAFLGLATVILL